MTVLPNAPPRDANGFVRELPPLPSVASPMSSPMLPRAQRHRAAGDGPSVVESASSGDAGSSILRAKPQRGADSANGDTSTSTETEAAGGTTSPRSEAPKSPLLRRALTRSPRPAASEPGETISSPVVPRAARRRGVDEADSSMASAESSAASGGIESSGNKTSPRAGEASAGGHTSPRSGDSASGSRTSPRSEAPKSPLLRRALTRSPRPATSEQGESISSPVVPRAARRRGPEEAEETVESKLDAAAQGEAPGPKSPTLGRWSSRAASVAPTPAINSPVLSRARKIQSESALNQQGIEPAAGRKLQSDMSHISEPVLERTRAATVRESGTHVVKAVYALPAQSDSDSDDAELHLPPPTRAVLDETKPFEERKTSAAFAEEESDDELPDVAPPPTALLNGLEDDDEEAAARPRSSTHEGGSPNAAPGGGHQPLYPSEFLRGTGGEQEEEPKEAADLVHILTWEQRHFGHEDSDSEDAHRPLRCLGCGFMNIEEAVQCENCHVSFNVMAEDFLRSFIQEELLGGLENALGIDAAAAWEHVSEPSAGAAVLVKADAAAAREHVSEPSADAAVPVKAEPCPECGAHANPLLSAGECTNCGFLFPMPDDFSSPTPDDFVSAVQPTLAAEGRSDCGSMIAPEWDAPAAPPAPSMSSFRDILPAEDRNDDCGGSDVVAKLEEANDHRSAKEEDHLLAKRDATSTGEAAPVAKSAAGEASPRPLSGIRQTVLLSFFANKRGGGADAGGAGEKRLGVGPPPPVSRAARRGASPQSVEKDSQVGSVSLCVCVCVYIYIYIYISQFVATVIWPHMVRDTAELRHNIRHFFDRLVQLTPCVVLCSTGGGSCRGGGLL
jgi:hypothetical protein